MSSSTYSGENRQTAPAGDRPRADEAADRWSDIEQGQLLRATLEQMVQGLVLLDRSQIVRLCNPRALELLDLPIEVLRERAAFRDIRAFQNARGDFSLMPSSMSSVSNFRDG